MDILRVLQRPLSKCRELFVLAFTVASCPSVKERMNDFHSYQEQMALADEIYSLPVPSCLLAHSSKNT